MPSKDIIVLLGGWKGCRVGTVARFEAGELSKYAREVIDKVRTAESKRQTACCERQVIKGSRRLLLRNKIKVIKRMGYGFRDDQYLFLKIRSASPGIPG